LQECKPTASEKYSELRIAACAEEKSLENFVVTVVDLNHFRNCSAFTVPQVQNKESTGDFNKEF
jgi:hypothetical protein